MTVPIVFCSGLVGLAVASLVEVEVPRWLILAHGIDCFLMALLALLLTRPWRRPAQAGAREEADSFSTGGGSAGGAFPAVLLQPQFHDPPDAHTSPARARLSSCKTERSLLFPPHTCAAGSRSDVPYSARC
jgi:hypothetical protein